MELREKIHINYDNGKIMKDVKVSQNGGIVTISDSFYSKYATILVYYPDSSNRVKDFTATYWVTDTPSTISFYINTSSNDPLNNCKISSGYTLNKMGQDNLDAFCAEEIMEFDNCFLKLINAETKKDSLRLQLEEKTKKLYLRELDFIKENPASYYSFWLFRREITGARFLKPDSLLTIYNHIFSDSLKNGYEGKEIVAILEGRMGAVKGNEAPKFIVKDIHGQEISLKGLNGKYVLLDFWASWCIPCLKDIPQLKKIRKHYSEDNLEIISISLDENYHLFETALRKNAMNWPQIFGYPELIKSYGLGPIPQTYLVDKDGTLIYSMEEEKDYSFVLLQKVLSEKIKQKMIRRK